ncbi:MAG: sirohydrochlorin chelatase [Streptomycetales bacterium]
MDLDRQPADGLPVRAPNSRRGGRHRKPQPLTVPTTAPALVLAVPGAARQDTSDITAEIAALSGSNYSGGDVRVGHLDGDEAGLGQVLAALRGERPTASQVAVVVPLLTGPHQEFSAALRRSVAESGVPVTVTEPLGPHPLLAEALHVRLAEAGLARADRIRLLSIVTAADGVIVATTGGDQAVQAAGVTAVLLAARLAIPVVAGSLDSPSATRAAVDGLREDGCTRPALAPCLVGPELDPSALAAAAEESGAECAEPLGAHSAVAQLVTLRYTAILQDLRARSAPAEPGHDDAAAEGRSAAEG